MKPEDINFSASLGDAFAKAEQAHNQPDPDIIEEPEAPDEPEVPEPELEEEQQPLFDPASDLLSDEPPPPPVVDEEEEEDLPEARPSDPKSFKKRLRQQKERIEGEFNGRLKDRDTEIERLKKEIATIQEQVKQVPDNSLSDQERDELAKLRKAFDLRNDPEVSKRFDSRIQSLSDRALELFEKFYSPEDVTKIKDRSKGDFVGFLESNPKVLKDIIESISDESTVDADLLKSFIVQAKQLRIDKDDYIKSESETATQDLEKRKQELRKQFEAETKKQQEELARVEKWREDVFSKGIFKVEAIPADATPEQVTALNEKNDEAKVMRSELTRILSTQSLDEGLQTALQATAAIFYKRQMDKAKAKTAALEKRLAEIKRSGSITPSGGQHAAKPPAPAPSLEDAWNQAASQKLRR
jgi:hypothetical protein